jgi:hypothetical protein
MEDNNKGLEEGITEPSKVLSIVHKRYNPRISLWYYEVIHIEEYGKLIHR